MAAFLCPGLPLLLPLSASSQEEYLGRQRALENSIPPKIHDLGNNSGFEMLIQLSDKSADLHQSSHKDLQVKTLRTVSL